MTELAHLLVNELRGDPDALEELRALLGAGDAEPWIGVEAAADHLGCKRQRVYNLVSQRAIPHHKEGSRLLFRRSELDAWLG